MYRLLGCLLAGGIVLGTAGSAHAQVSLSIGNPYTGTGFALGVPGVGAGYYGMNGYGYPYGGGLYSGYASAPLVGTTYSSGYAGYVAPATGYFTTGTYGLYPTTSVYSYPTVGYGYGGFYGAPYRYSPYRYGYGGWGRGWRRW